MNRCPAVDQLRRLLRGQLGDAEAAPLDAHLDTCEACRRILAALSEEEEATALPLRPPADPSDVPAPDFLQRLKDNPPECLVASGPGSLAFGPPTPHGPLGRLGSYHIVREIGSGGFGIVYLAWDEDLKRNVAIKVLRPERASNPEDRARFAREGRKTADVKDPHVVQILHVGAPATGVPPHLVMEYVEGESLRKRLERSGRLGAREAAEIVRQAALGLAAAHEKGQVHRDVKPDNILLAGQSGEVKITDFGLARGVDAASGRISNAEAMVGTCEYVSPEQAQTPASVDRRTDVYSLGVVLYELLTGRTPFQGETPVEILLQTVRNDPRPPREWNSAIPPALEAIALKCLGREPSWRYQTARELADDLGRFLNDEPVVARPPALWEWVASLCRRFPVAASLAGAALALLVLVATVGASFGAYYYWSAHKRLELLTAEQKAREDEARANEKTTQALAQVTDEQKRTEEQKRTAESLLAYNSLTVARGEWLGNDPERAEQALDECPNHLRRWEWHLLKRATRSDLLSLRVKLGDLVTSIAFSPDGTQLATTTADSCKAVPGDVDVWDAPTGRKLRTLTGHSNKVTAVAYHPDGSRLASASWDGTIRIWDAKSGELLRELKGEMFDNHPFPILCLAYSKDGTQLATGDWEGNVKVWGPGGGMTSRLTIRAHENPSATRPTDYNGISRAAGVAFSPDGRSLASAGWDGYVRVWNTADGSLRLTLPGQARGVSGVAFSPDGNLLASSSLDGTIKVWWNLHLAQPTVRVITGHNQSVTSVAFSPDGLRLASAGVDGTVRLWDPQTGQGLDIYRGHTVPLHAVTFSPDGRRLASAGGNLNKPGEVKVWDTLRGQVWQSFRPDPPAGASLAFDGTRFAVGGEDGTVTVRDAASGKVLLKLKAHAKEVTSVAFSPDGKLIATGGQDRKVATWDAATGSPVAVGNEHQGEVTCVAFGGPGGALASASKDGTARLWKPGDGKCLVTLQVSALAVNAVAFSPDGGLLVTGAADGNVVAWDTRTWEELFRLRHPMEVLCVGFSPDGTRLAAGSLSLGNASLLRVWDVESRKELWVGGELNASVRSLGFSPDGSRLAFASDMTPLVRVMDAATGREVLSLYSGSELRPRQIAFSPPGTRQRLAVLAGDGVVRLADGEPVAETRTWAGGLVASIGAAFSPDGKRLAWGGLGDERGSVFIADLKRGKIVTALNTAPSVAFALAFSPDGKTLAVGGGPGETRGIVTLWDAETGRLLLELEAHSARVFGVAFSPDGKRLATAGGRSLKVWDLGDLQNVRELFHRTHSGLLRTVAFSPDGKTITVNVAPPSPNRWGLLSRTWDRAAEKVEAMRLRDVFLWDAATGDRVRALDGHGGASFVAFSPRGDRLASAGRDRVIIIWDTGTWKPVARLSGHDQTVLSLAFSPDGDFLLSSEGGAFRGGPGKAKLWDLRTQKELTTFGKHGDGIWTVALSPDGSQVATSSADGRLGLWDAAVLRRAADHPEDTELLRNRHREIADESEPIRRWTALVFHLGQLLEDEPDNLGYLIRRGRALGAVGDHERAHDDLAKVTRAYPRAAQGGDAAAVVGLLAGPGPASPFMALATLTATQGPEGPRKLAWHLERAAEAEKARSWSAADYHLTRAICASPQDGGLRMRRADARAELGRWREAENDLSAADALGTDGPWVYWRRILLRLRVDDQEGAEKLCTRMLARHGTTKDPATGFWTAWTYFHLPRKVEQVEPLQLTKQALAADPKNIEYRRTAGLLFLRGEEFEAAAERFQELIKNDPGGGIPLDWLMLAISLHRSGKPAEARPWLERGNQWLEAHARERENPESMFAYAWHHWLQVQLMAREARTALQADAPR